MNTSVCTALFAVAGLAAGCSPAPTASGVPENSCRMSSGVYTDFPTANGTRTFEIAMPSDASSSTPMVVALHGATGSEASMESKLTSGVKSRMRNAITVYPRSFGPPLATVWDARPGSADVRFVATLIRHLHGQGCSSPAYTLVTGFSMGAMVASRAACRNPKLMSSVVMVSGALPPLRRCKVRPDTSLAVVHGRADEVVPFDGSLPRNLQPFTGGSTASVPGTSRVKIARQWAVAKGCPMPQRRTKSAKGTRTVGFECHETSETLAVVYRSTGHEWPRPADRRRSPSEVILRFLGL